MLVNEILLVKPQGVLNAQGHRVFNVVDTKTGQTVKSFSSPNPKNAMDQAKQYSNDENKKLKKANKANKNNNNPKNPEKTPKPDAKPDAKKPGKIKTALNKGGRLLKNVAQRHVWLAPIVLGNAKMVTYADGYINNYVDNNYSDAIQPDVEDSDRYVKAMAYYKLQLGKTSVSVFVTMIESAVYGLKAAKKINKALLPLKTFLLGIPGLGWAGWIISGILQLVAAGAFWWATKVLIDLQIKIQDPKVTRFIAEAVATRVFAPGLISYVAGVPGVTSGRFESIEEDRYMVVEEMEVPTDLIKKAKAIFKKKVPKDKWKEIKAR